MCGKLHALEPPGGVARTPLGTLDLERMSDVEQESLVLCRPEESVIAAEDQSLLEMSRLHLHSPNSLILAYG
jgi:hypothetical protein